MSRGWRRIMIVRAGPAIEPNLLDVAQLLPAQLPRRRGVTNTGARGLLVRLLALALHDAGWPHDGRTITAPTGSVPRDRVPTRHRVRWQMQRTLAYRWLLGELDDQVAVPIRLVCDVLGIDSVALAAAVRRSQGEAGGADSTTTTR